MSNLCTLVMIYLSLSVSKGSDDLYKAMDDVADVHEDRIASLEKIFSYTLSGFLCMQVGVL